MSNINNADWNTVPAFDTYWVKQEFMEHYTYDWLKGSAHPGAGVLETMSCTECHKDDKSLIS